MDQILYALKRVLTDEYFLGYYDQYNQEPDYLKISEDKLTPNVLSFFKLFFFSLFRFQ